jgi:catechol 2,3-dioxygenase-like lactoylglutathione lyase family enzyme
MPLTGLFHVAIKTADLAATVRFYREVMGLIEVKRPAFDFQGAWLALPSPGGEAIIHLYAGDRAKGPEGTVPAGTGALDHVSIAAHGYHEFRARFERFGLPYREFLVPGRTLWQLFVYDPSGVLLELTFEGAGETGAPPDTSPARKAVAGRDFFDPSAYKRFAVPETVSK